MIIFDEIHQLPEASMLLKIAADQYPNIKVLATGSSTLVAGKKFKDTLTGRKRNIHMLPILVEELGLFEVNLKQRLLRGGLPPPLLSRDYDLDFYGEWLDSFYARDIQEIFAVEKRQPFLKALEYLLVENSNLFEVTKLGQAAGVSRPTVTKYLEILELTNAVSVIRPLATNPEQELVSQPKVYGFDTGFCCYAQGIREVNTRDAGPLLENLTLETLQAHGVGRDIRYWRTKTKKEIDFILVNSKENYTTIECQWQEKSFSDDAIRLFRSKYPTGKNWVITSDSITRIDGNIKFINIRDLSKELVSRPN